MSQTYKGKKLLLLSGPMGTGHVQAANSLEEWTHQCYPEITVLHKSVEEYMSPLAIFVYITYYHFMLRHFAWLWGWLYKRLNQPANNASILSKLFEKLGFSAESSVLKLLEDYQPDFIICTHFLAAGIMAKAKRDNIPLPIVGIVVTDFSIHWTYVHNELDLFFVPTQSMALLLHLRGIERHKIFVTGCPTKPGFEVPYTAEDCARYRHEFKLPEGDYVMVMMGGESIGRVAEISKKVLECFPDVHVLAMAGKNERLYKHLCELQKNPKFRGHLIPVPFTQRVRDYMALSFVMISKPGGIFTSEAWAMNKPMILMDPIPGHEEKNAVYLASQGVAAMVMSLPELNYIPIEPCATWIDIIRINQRNNPMKEAGKKIIEMVLNEANERCAAIYDA